MNRAKTARARLAGVVTAMAIGGMVNTVVAGKGGPPASDVSVTANVSLQVNGAPLRIQGDDKGAYTSTTQVTSVIMASSHDWLLQTYFTAKGKTAASDRSVFFDLTEPAAGSNPPPPLATGFLQARLIVSCTNGPQPVDMLTLTVGAQVLCAGHFNFIMPDLKTYYRLHFKPSVYAETNWIQVTCTAAYARGGCGAWTFAPTGTPTPADPNLKNVGRLLKIDSGGIVLDDTLGDYYVSFAINVTR